MPRAGSTVFLIPVVPHGVARLMHDARGVTVLRAGWISGSLVVRIDGNVPVMAMLRAGVVPMGAPAVFCGGGAAQ